ncbi:MAG TPA: DUF6290 family protein [Tissierellaceae bacterium]|nr:DUF6290 family protein [Tissierellaceae bacterium]
MSSITLRMSDEENRLIRNYAKANNITISELMRQAVLEKIEDEIDLDIYTKAMKEHEENPEDISFDEMMDELGFNE